MNRLWPRYSTCSYSRQLLLSRCTAPHQHTALQWCYSIEVRCDQLQQPMTSNERCDDAWVNGDWLTARRRISEAHTERRWLTQQVVQCNLYMYAAACLMDAKRIDNSTAINSRYYRVIWSRARSQLKSFLSVQHGLIRFLNCCYISFIHSSIHSLIVNCEFNDLD